MTNCETNHEYDEKSLDLIKKLLKRLSITTKNVEIIGNATISQVVKNIDSFHKTKQDFDNFHSELDKIREETQALNNNLPSARTGVKTSYEDQVREALGKAFGIP